MLELREFETRVADLTREQAAHLAEMTRGTLTPGEAPRVIQQIAPTATEGRYEVRAGPYVGRFGLRDGLTVDIAGRFGFTDLLEVLRVAARRPSLLDDAPVPARAGHGLLDLVAVSFVREVETLVGFGLAKAYLSRTFTRPPYPGVPDATAHLARHMGRPDRLITRARRLTVDVPANQLLAAALRVLRAQRYHDPALAPRLRALAPAFTGVTPVSEPLRQADAARRNAPARYGDALALAALVLSGGTTLPAGAGLTGTSVLFSMPHVWESYVRARLEPALPPGHRIRSQYPIRLTDDASAMTARADLVETDATGAPVRLYDAKYKPWAAKPSTGDLYQMITYAHRLHLNRATLVYPGRGERSEVVVGGYRVLMWGLDVLAPSG